MTWALSRSSRAAFAKRRWRLPPRNAADFEDKYSYVCSGEEPGQWICLEFKTLRVEPTPHMIRTGTYSRFRSWAVEGSEDGAARTEIDRSENNSGLSGREVMKTFTVSPSESFGRIHLRQAGPNHSGNNVLILKTIELFGVVAGRQEPSK
jgi:hypothetical protein